MVKLARAHGVEELLPFTVKGTDTRIQKRIEHGLRVRGTGVGQKVKGKIWERTMRNRLEDRKQAMLGMPQLIQDWKDVSKTLASKCLALFLFTFFTVERKSRLEGLAQIRSRTNSATDLIESTSRTQIEVIKSWSKNWVIELAKRSRDLLEYLYRRTIPRGELVKVISC